MPLPDPGEAHRKADLLPVPPGLKVIVHRAIDAEDWLKFVDLMFGTWTAWDYSCRRNAARGLLGILFFFTRASEEEMEAILRCSKLYRKKMGALRLVREVIADGKRLKWKMWDPGWGAKTRFKAKIIRFNDLRRDRILLNGHFPCRQEDLARYLGLKTDRWVPSIAARLVDDGLLTKYREGQGNNNIYDLTLKGKLLRRQLAEARNADMERLLAAMAVCFSSSTLPPGVPIATHLPLPTPHHRVDGILHPNVDVGQHRDLQRQSAFFRYIDLNGKIKRCFQKRQRPPPELLRAHEQARLEAGLGPSHPPLRPSCPDGFLTATDLRVLGLGVLVDLIPDEEKVGGYGQRVRLYSRMSIWFQISRRPELRLAVEECIPKAKRGRYDSERNFWRKVYRIRHAKARLGLEPAVIKPYRSALR